MPFSFGISTISTIEVAVIAYYHLRCLVCVGCYATVLMDGSSVLTPSYLRRPDSYDRLGTSRSHSQRFLPNRLLVAGTSSAQGEMHAVLFRHC